MPKRKTSGTAPERASYDLYYAVHKGLRLGHGRVLQAIATCDPGDRQALAALIETVRAHLALCRSHLESENARLHTAFEARAPGVSAMAEAEHDDHDAAMAELQELLQALETAEPEAAAAGQRALYRRFALFVAHDIEHMDGEEYELMPAMQEHFTDAELMALTAEVRAALSPETSRAFLRLILAAASPPERAQLLTGMRGGMPPPAFDALVAELAGGPWRDGDWRAFDRL